MLAKLWWPFDIKQLKNAGKSNVKAMEESLNQRRKGTRRIKRGFKFSFQRKDRHHTTNCHTTVTLSEVSSLRKWCQNADQFFQLSYVFSRHRLSWFVSQSNLLRRLRSSERKALSCLNELFHLVSLVDGVDFPAPITDSN